MAVPRAMARWHKRALGLLLAFGLCLQGLIGAAHRHDESPRSGWAIATPTGTVSRSYHRAPPADHCPLCRALAAAAHYTPPPAPAFAAPLAWLALAPSVLTPAETRLARLHFWHSRAPPALRQA